MSFIQFLQNKHPLYKEVDCSKIKITLDEAISLAEEWKSSLSIEDTFKDALIRKVEENEISEIKPIWIIDNEAMENAHLVNNNTTYVTPPLHERNFINDETPKHNLDNYLKTSG